MPRRLRPAVLASLPCLLPAQQLTRDLNQTFNSVPFTYRLSYAESDGQRAFFDGWSQDTGTELWITDGTVPGTHLLRDLRPGADSERPQPIGFLGNRLLLSTVDDATGRSSNLWVSDGTTQGTIPLSNAPSSVGGFFELGTAQGRLIFFAYNANALWSTDLTTAGTQQNAACTVQGFAPSVSLGNLVVFGANGDAAGNEPWVSNGTTAGTFRIGDIRAGGSSDPDQFTRLGNAAFFLATNAAFQTELWRTDGTAAGTARVLTTPVARQPGQERLVTAGNHLAAILGGALWSSDGTATSTQQLLPPVGTSTVRALFSDGATAYAVRGSELWVTDGTAAGTNLVVDLAPGTGNQRSVDDRSFVQQGVLWLAMSSGTVVNLDVIRSDGTAAGTSRLQVPGLQASMFAPVGNGVVLSARTLAWFPDTLFATDGNTVQTLWTATMRPGIRTGHSAAVDGVLYLALDDGTNGMELWRSDGTAAGTQMVVDLEPNGGSSMDAGSEMVALDGVLYFIASSPFHAGALRRSDGTAAGTSIVFEPSPPFPFARLQTYGHDLYFTGFDPQRSHRCVFRSDGTPAGTLPITTTVMPLGGTPYSVLGGVVIHGSPTSALQRSDGTAAGTFALPAPGPAAIAELGSRIVFVAESAGRELFVTDGTVAGTRQLTTSIPFPSSTIPAPVIWRGSACWFVNGELICSDGTVAGTTRTFPPLPPGVRELVPAGNALYCVARDAAAGAELWRTDGTVAGTFRVTDLAPSFQDGVQSVRAVALGNRLLLAASNGQDGSEPWLSDGTAAGTVRIADIAPRGSSNPQFLAVAGDRVFFLADDGVTGQELWSMPLGVLGNAALEAIGAGCAGSNGIPDLQGLAAPRIGGALDCGLQRVRPLAPVLLGLATDEAPSPWSGTCTLQLAGSVALLLATSDGLGNLRRTFAIPAAPALVGAKVVAQAGVLDPLGAGGGLAFSNGLLAVVGR
jgi:ELWxxDGT repeat protein